MQDADGRELLREQGRGDHTEAPGGGVSGWWSSWQISSPTEGTLPIDLYIVDPVDPVAPVRLHWIVAQEKDGALSVTAGK
jgi:hypothetical protein